MHNENKNEADVFSELPVGTVAKLKRCFALLQSLEESLSKSELLHLFFREALTPYYDCMYSGLQSNVGHIIYRLSDNVEESLRRKIEIYPNLNGNGWVSLEDWRNEWTADNTHIPNVNLLPE